MLKNYWLLLLLSAASTGLKYVSANRIWLQQCLPQPTSPNHSPLFQEATSGSSLQKDGRHLIENGNVRGHTTPTTNGSPRPSDGHQQGGQAGFLQGLDDRSQDRQPGAGRHSQEQRCWPRRAGRPGAEGREQRRSPSQVLGWVLRT